MFIAPVFGTSFLPSESAASCTVNGQQKCGLFITKMFVRHGIGGAHLDLFAFQKFKILHVKFHSENN